MTTMPAPLALRALLPLSSRCATTPAGYTELELQARRENTGGRWHRGRTRTGFGECQSPGMI
jgi:hypothetical protein